jgi:hypothetical protein
MLIWIFLELVLVLALLGIAPTIVGPAREPHEMRSGRSASPG